MANFCPECGIDLRKSGTTKGEVRKTARRAYEDTPSQKRKRKPSAYNRFMSKELKILRRKHPRTSQANLMKKAAKIWRSKKRKR